MMIDQDGETASGDDWIERLLLSEPPGDIADAGFSAAVMLRIARLVTHRLAPAAALAAAAQRQRSEAIHTRWTLGGTLVGSVVALLLWPVSTSALVQTNPLSSLAGLISISLVLGFLALRAGSD
ncbi:MAG: hypothetical protein M3Z16_12620 [Pseudomonadota bacterium]|nr:hypothetical protein [Pseudomonadota bacterium]